MKSLSSLQPHGRGVLVKMESCGSQGFPSFHFATLAVSPGTSQSTSLDVSQLSPHSLRTLKAPPQRLKLVSFIDPKNSQAWLLELPPNSTEPARLDWDATVL